MIMDSSGFWGLILAPLGFTGMGMVIVLFSRLNVYERDPMCNTRSTKENLKNTFRKLRKESRSLFLVAIGIYVFFLVVILGIIYAPQFMWKIDNLIEEFYKKFLS
ncbi:MAG: hypothetical protein JSW40_04330 [Candidatus Omnitrophota bacterium]|nr:MAG: hypothetical protein JSW40_04330 [Candidatus Omnitrophota bacterium]